VTETTEATTDTIKQSLLDSQESSVVTDFYNNLERARPRAERTSSTSISSMPAPTVTQGRRESGEER
jgi:hypothetical protein